MSQIWIYVVNGKPEVSVAIVEFHGSVPDCFHYTGAWADGTAFETKTIGPMGLGSMTEFALNTILKSIHLKYPNKPDVVLIGPCPAPRLDL